MNNILFNNLPLLVLNQVVSLLYLSTTFLYGAHFFKDSEFAKTYKQPLLALTVLTHVVYLGLLTSLEGYKISYSTVNLMTMVALTLTITYLFIEFTTKSDKTGFFVIAFAAGAPHGHSRRRSTPSQVSRRQGSRRRWGWPAG